MRPWRLAWGAIQEPTVLQVVRQGTRDTDPDVAVCQRGQRPKEEELVVLWHHYTAAKTGQHPLMRVPAKWVRTVQALVAKPGQWLPRKSWPAKQPGPARGTAAGQVVGKPSAAIAETWCRTSTAKRRAEEEAQVFACLPLHDLAKPAAAMQPGTVRATSLESSLVGTRQASGVV